MAETHAATGNDGDREQLRRTVESLGWWHSIDLGGGLVTPGHKTTTALQREYDALGLPDLTGKSVLDIGAWDGYFSFEAERRGAARVVALDYFVWSLDNERYHAYRADCLAQGIDPQPYDEVPGIWRPDDLPGKRTFDLAREALGSSVETLVADVSTLDPAVHGVFDVVIFSGVLYHMRDPFDIMRRVAAVTREMCAIETAAVYLPGNEARALFEFYPGAEMHGDPSNWWAPNAYGLEAICHGAGFSRVHINFDRPELDRVAGGEYMQYRLVADAWK